MSFARFLPAVVSLALVGCPGRPVAPIPSPVSQAQVALSHLPPLKPAQGHYALWAIADATTSEGVAFLVAEDGHLTDLAGSPWDGRATFALPRADLKELRLTQEPPAASHRTPSKQLLLKGPVQSGKADLALAAPFEPGALETSTGSYLLDNPSTESLADMNGVCFMNERRSGGGLQVPFPPPEEWGYESWIELKGKMLPLGKFVDPDGPDDWNGYSGRMPPFPGEDFNENLPEGITGGFNLPDLRGARLIISVESRSLKREEVYPSAIRLFEATIPLDAEHYKAYPMRNVAAEGLPGGTATLVD